MACTNESLSDFSQLIYSLAGDCSEHGNCLDGTCVCDPGWTGVSDILSLEGTSCHIPVRWHPLVFMPLLLLHIGGVFLIVKQLIPIISRIRKRIRSQNKERYRGHLSNFWHFKADATAARAYDPITVLVPLLFGYVLSIVYLVLKGFVPDTALGSSSLSSIVVSILFPVRELCFFIAIGFFAGRINIETSARAVGIDPANLVRSQLRLSCILFLVLMLLPRFYITWISVAAESRYPSIHGVAGFLIINILGAVYFRAYLPAFAAIRVRFKTALDDLHAQRSETAAGTVNLRRDMMIEKLEIALTKLDDTVKTATKTINYGLIFLVLQSIPQLFPYGEYMAVLGEYMALVVHEEVRKLFAERKVAPELGTHVNFTGATSGPKTPGSIGDLFASSGAE